jgi:hypothetical protein
MRRSLLLLPCLALVLAGCGGDWGTASGTVTLDGTPLAAGQITFHPEGGGATAYGTVQDGSFTISTGQKAGLKAGKCKVTVFASTIPKEGTKEVAKMLTPVKYSRAESSPFEANVQGGSNSFKFEMVSK